MNANFVRMHNLLACVLLWTALTKVEATSKFGFRLPEREAAVVSSAGVYGEFQLTLGREIVWSEGGGQTLVPSSDPRDGFFADHGGVIRRGLSQKFYLPKFQGSIDVWYYCRYKDLSLDSVEWVGLTDLADYFPLPGWMWRSMLAQNAQVRPEEETPTVASHQTKLLMLQMHVHVSALCLSRPSDVLERYNAMIAAFDIAFQLDDHLLPDDDDEDDDEDDEDEHEDDHDHTDSKENDSVYSLAYGELTDLTTMRLARHLDLSAADTVVDLGSGKGRVATLMAMATPAHVFGIEIDSARHHAATKLTQWGAKNGYIAADEQSRLVLVHGDGFRHQALVNQLANQSANRHSSPQAPRPITVILFIQLAEEPLLRLLLQSLAILPTQGVTIVSATRLPPSLLELHNDHAWKGVEGVGHAVSLHSPVMDVSTTWSTHLPLYVYRASPTYR